MKKPDRGDRLVSAAVGAFFGAIIGLCLAWLLGVYSHTLGAGRIHVRFDAFAILGAVLLGLLGLLLGSNAGSVIGSVFALIYEFENNRESDSSIQQWLAVVVFALVGLALWWMFLS